ncbi:unnamed protein product, partial [Phaeothamnion confervicola]
RLAAHASCCRHLCRQVLELWGAGSTVDAVAVEVKAFPEELKRPHLAESVSWSVVVAGIGYRRSAAQQEELRKRFAFLPFKGPVRCCDPDQVFWLLEKFNPTNVRHPDRQPEALYFGREVGRSSRNLVTEMQLSHRRYLGPTSMDNELALIMANMVLAGKGKTVFDPFVGTASILVACARFGAFCVGTDIDLRVLRGKDGVGPFSNFDQYGLPRPELVRSDNSLFKSQFR